MAIHHLSSHYFMLGIRVLGPTSFLEERLKAGRLVVVFDQILITDLAYYLVCPKAHLQRAEVRAFKDWLLAQI